jgi:hypothetical protein
MVEDAAASDDLAAAMVMKRLVYLDLEEHGTGRTPLLHAPDRADKADTWAALQLVPMPHRLGQAQLPPSCFVSLLADALTGFTDDSSSRVPTNTACSPYSRNLEHIDCGGGGENFPAICVCPAPAGSTADLPSFASTVPAVARSPGHFFQRCPHCPARAVADDTTADEAVGAARADLPATTAVQLTALKV